MSNKASSSDIVSYANTLQDRSELAQEIVTRKADFSEKWALSIFTGVLLIILLLSWIIKYPYTIETRATLTAVNAPKEIINHQQGRIIKILKTNNDLVEQNEVFAWLESTANHEEVMELSSQLDSSIHLLNYDQIEKVATLFEKKYNNLGELQPEFRNFFATLITFKDYLVNGFYLKKKSTLANDIKDLQDVNQTIMKQKTLTEQDLVLAEESYKMNETLFNEKVLSKEEYRNEKSKYMNKQMSLPQLQANLLANQTAIRDKMVEINQLDHDIAQQKQVFQQSLQSLKSSVDDWKKKYLFCSPIRGRLSYIMPLQENQFVPINKLIGYINPEDSHIYMETTLPQDNFGKIDTGLNVQLRFDAYPYQEVGFVKGTLQYISTIPSDSGFLATIRLNNGLTTNNNVNINYKTGLKAQALIITKDMRLLERFYYSFKKSASIGKN